MVADRSFAPSACEIVFGFLFRDEPLWTNLAKRPCHDACDDAGGGLGSSISPACREGCRIFRKATVLNRDPPREICFLFRGQHGGFCAGQSLLQTRFPPLELQCDFLLDFSSQQA